MNGEDDITDERVKRQGVVLLILGLLNSVETAVVIIFLALMLIASVGTLVRGDEAGGEGGFEGLDEFSETAEIIFIIIVSIALVFLLLFLLSYIWMTVGGARMLKAGKLGKGHSSLFVPILFIFIEFGMTILLFLLSLVSAVSTSAVVLVLAVKMSSIITIIATKVVLTDPGKEHVGPG